MRSGMLIITNSLTEQTVESGNIQTRERSPGISGNVDLDTGFIDYPTIIRTAGLNHLSDAPVSPAPEPEPPDYITYIIQPGDTLSQLAVRFGTTVNVLASLNDLTDPDLIYAGQTLRIPKMPMLLFYITPSSREIH